MKNGNYQELEDIMQPRQIVLKSLQQQLNDAREKLKEPQENYTIKQKQHNNQSLESTQSFSSRILVIDDNDENRELLEIFLAEYGYEVVSATNGYEAWYMIQNEKLDLVLTDICMPGVSGNELAQYIKSYKKTLPVIAITGSSWLAGSYFDKIITKPLRLPALLYWVKFFLAKVSILSGTD